MSKRKCFRIFGFIVFAVVLCFHGLYADDFSVSSVEGKIGLKRNGGSFVSLKGNESLNAGDFIRSYRDSAVIFSSNGNYYKLFSYGAMRIEERPVLIYGKLSRSDSQHFLDAQFYFSPKQPLQGQTMKVILKSLEKNVKVTAYMSNEKGYRGKLFFYPIGNSKYRSLTGFDVEAAPVKYTLLIIVEDQNGGVSEIIYPFYLKKTTFEKGKVFLSKQKSALFGPSEQKTREIKLLAKILSSPSETAFWEKKFIFPVEQPNIISSFGKKRMYYIGGAFSFIRFHRGIDFQGEKGDTVIAPNNGKVMFTGLRITTGNTVVIDHGQGVFSLFFHLDSISVEKGSMVAKGDKIGEIGSTGIAEGDHLHWGLYLNSVYVDPFDWIQRIY